MSRWSISTPERIEQKKDRLQMLNALLDMHQLPDCDHRDHDYIRELKQKISKVRAELRNMGIDLLGDA